MHPTLVILVVGLTPNLIGPHTPNLKRLVDRGALRPLTTVMPAVTCTVQSTLVTGLAPSGHGAVANGWYFRDLAEVWLWRQSNRLVGGEKIWEAARRRDPAFTCAKMFWWYNMYASVDWSATPRPMYPADERWICARDQIGAAQQKGSRLGVAEPAQRLRHVAASTACPVLHRSLELQIQSATGRTARTGQGHEHRARELEAARFLRPPRGCQVDLIRKDALEKIGPPVEPGVVGTAPLRGRPVGVRPAHVVLNGLDARFAEQDRALRGTCAAPPRPACARVGTGLRKQPSTEQKNTRPRERPPETAASIHLGSPVAPVRLWRATSLLLEPDRGRDPSREATCHRHPHPAQDHRARDRDPQRRDAPRPRGQAEESGL